MKHPIETLSRGFNKFLTTDNSFLGKSLTKTCTYFAVGFGISMGLKYLYDGIISFKRTF